MNDYRSVYEIVKDSVTAHREQEEEQEGPLMFQNGMEGLSWPDKYSAASHLFGVHDEQACWKYRRQVCGQFSDHVPCRTSPYKTQLLTSAIFCIIKVIGLPHIIYIPCLSPIAIRCI
jgi:hypothetical protein